MGYFVENWGSFVGLLGLLASIGGLVYASLARRAAKSAEQAANEARNSITQTLCLVSAQRALSVIVRLNALHRDESWVAALELYRELRALLNDINGTMPEKLSHLHTEISRGIGQLSLIQSLVQDFLVQGIDPTSFQALGETLNLIETSLEALVSNIIPPSAQEGESNG